MIILILTQVIIMGKKKKGAVPTFKECVTSRYKKDTIMGLFATVMVFLTPLLVMGLLMVLVYGDIEAFSKYAALQDYRNLMLEICVMIWLFTLMDILYLMYIRLRSHAGRDRAWRASLIQFVDKMGGNSETLRDANKRIGRWEHFLLTPVITILMIAMYVYCVVLFIFYVPQWAQDQDLETFNIAMAMGLLLCFIMGFLILYKVLSFAYKHEKRQSEFTHIVSEELGKVGVHVPPMINVVPHHSKFLTVLLILITGTIYLYYLIYVMFRNMNVHLKNQWEYESEMLRVIESDGELLFETYMPDYFVEGKMSKRDKKNLNKKYYYEISSRVKTANKMPFSLVIAELFLIILVANYILKIVALVVEISAGNYGISLENLESLTQLDTKQLMNLGMIALDLLLLMLCISALLGIASRKPSSWRKVTRSCITFVLPLWASLLLDNAAGYTHIFDFNPYATTAVLAFVFLLMMASHKIREFYSPVGDEMPGLFTWLRFVFFGKLNGKNVDYSIDDAETDLQ